MRTVIRKVFVNSTFLGSLVLLPVLGAFLASCSSGGGGGNTSPLVSLGTVTALYPANGGDWNDYVKNDGTSRFAGTDTACDPAVDGPGYDACIHGGEMRVVEATGVTSCAGLTASDALGAFDWVCDDSAGTVRFVSTGLKNGKYLSDLIDFDAPAWKSNVVTVSGTGSGKTPSSAWWSSPFVIDNDGMTALEMNAAGTIYLVTAASATGSYDMGADKVALVIKPGMTLKGLGTNGRVIDATSHNFLWIEGSVDATGDSSGVFLGLVKFSVLRNVLAEHAISAGVYLDSSHSNNLSLINANNNSTGIGLSSSSYNHLAGITASNSPSAGIALSVDSNDNDFTHVFSHNNANGLAINSSSRNNFEYVSSSNNNSIGIYLGSAMDNRMRHVIATNNGDGFALFASNSNAFQDVTTSNNSGNGIYLTGSDYNTLANVTAANNLIGIQISVSSNDTVSGAAVGNNSTGIAVSSASSNYFTEVLKVGSNGTNCLVGGGTDPGLTDVTCDQQGASDYGTPVTGITLASSFWGKVTTEDTVNSSDTDGTASYPADPAIFDWVNFENPFRAWGRDGADFPAADNRGTWTTGAGRIWDWSLSATDTVIRSVLALPTGNDTLIHTWSDLSTTTFLRRAVEIQDDGIGNDNSLCESNETCLYTLNIGSYQGHGNLVSAGTFTNGTLTGITLLKYETNGY